jgi:uncharacterized membrane protein
MNQLVVVAFDNLDDARRVMASLRGLEKQGQIAFEDTAIVSREPDGTTHVRNEVSGTTETAAAIGGAIGLLVTFFFPLVGVVVGAAAGAAVGALLHTGVEGRFVDEVKRTLTPGRSALFLVVKQANADALVAALRPFEGEVLQTTLDPDLEDSLRQALE